MPRASDTTALTGTFHQYYSVALNIKMRNVLEGTDAVTDYRIFYLPTRRSVLISQAIIIQMSQGAKSLEKLLRSLTWRTRYLEDLSICQCSTYRMRKLCLSLISAIFLWFCWASVAKNITAYMSILAVIPRQLFSVIGNCYLGGIFSRVWIDHDVRRFNWIIAISIVGAYRFYEATNLLGLVGYHRYHYISTSTTNKKTIPHYTTYFSQAPSVRNCCGGCGYIIVFCTGDSLYEPGNSLQAKLLVYDTRYRA